MGYSSKGYNVVYVSPVLSFFAMLFLFAVGLPTVTDWFLQTVMLALVQVFLICIQVVGLAFCFAGFEKHESIPSSISMSLFLAILLALWGLFTIFLALGFYSDLLQWSTMPEVRSLTIWDHLAYLTWAFKGSLWVLAGITLPIMAFIRRKSLHDPIQIKQVHEDSTDKQ